ncbi:hypothetical protein RSSM_05883 [Rhodopirellula sallentina SM41]|uniref:Uncharacterized protein n=1 Tax=Rhodopirellula sallentina SM41 TaxID=1263870 RepID=M5U473_9BACT|nr:hypothetical protein RSSM_05883 [Rhodopirellula sallentina SM41]
MCSRNWNECFGPLPFELPLESIAICLKSGTICENLFESSSGLIGGSVDQHAS